MYKFQNLIVWKNALELVKNIYIFSEELKDYTLKDQLRRAATSICINIAEGSSAQNDKESNRYLYIARKSLYETVACLKIINEIYKKDIESIEVKINEVG